MTARGRGRAETWPALVALLLTAALEAAPVGAQPEAARLAVWVDPCVPIDAARFRHLLGIELDGMDVYATGPSERGVVATVSLTCVATRIRLELEDSITGKAMSRLIDLQPVAPSARTRLTAVTVSEFVLASWLEVRLASREVIRPAATRPQPPAAPAQLPRSSPPAAPQPSLPAPPAPAEPKEREPVELAPPPSASTEEEPLPSPPPAARDRVERLVERELPTLRPLQLEAAFSVLGFTSALQAIPSGELRLGYPFGRGLVLRVGLQLGHAELQQTTPLGNGAPLHVSTTLGSLLLALSYVLPLGELDWTAGLGARVGLVSFSGVAPADRRLLADQSYAPWAGPLLATGTAVHLGAHWQLTAALELGLVALRPRALAPVDTIVLELSDLWGAIALGVAWSP